MESHQLTLINLVIPPMNPIPRDRNNIGKLSSSRYISLISSDIASLSYGLPLHEIDRQQNLCHPRIFSKCIVFTIRKISLQICYHDDVLLWRSDYARVDLHFLPLLKPLFTWESNHLHMGLLVFTKCTWNIQLVENLLEIYSENYHVTANPELIQKSLIT